MVDENWPNLQADLAVTMQITKTLYVTNRNDWRDWLHEYYQSEAEIWLVYYRKQSGKPRILYNSAVEEALCFGWIDSIVKSFDQDRTVQRFTPRKSKSKYSQTNIERLRRLIDLGKVLPEIQASLDAILTKEFVYPQDIMAPLQANELAWQNFQGYSGAYQRIRIAYVDTARNRPGAFEKRLHNLIKKSAQNKQFGFGIADYY